jgi:hypothetical protein
MCGTGEKIRSNNYFSNLRPSKGVFDEAIGELSVLQEKK